MPPTFQTFKYKIPVFSSDTSHRPIFYESEYVIDPGSAIEDRDSSPKIDLLCFVQGMKFLRNFLNRFRLRLCQRSIG